MQSGFYTYISNKAAEGISILKVFDRIMGMLPFYLFVLFLILKYTH